MYERDRFSEMKGNETTNTLLSQPYLKNCSYLFYDSERLKEIPEIYEICKYATDMSYMFAANCGTDVDLQLDKIDTSNVKTMRGMFGNIGTIECWESFDLSKLDMSNVEDLSWLFRSCHALKTINMNGTNTKNAKFMTGTFSGIGATELDISALNTESVTDVRLMFSNCYDLLSLNTQFNQFANVENFSSMFSGCFNLKSIPVFSTEKANNLEKMFSGCTTLESVSSLSNWSLSNASSIVSMFSGCSNLKSIPVKSWTFKNGNLKTVANVFNGCSSLTSLDLTSWNTKNTYNFSKMFYNCSSLTYIDISNWHMESAQDSYNPNRSNFESMFSGCTSLRTLKMGTIPDFKYYPADMFKGVPTDCLIEVPDADTRYLISKINNFKFTNLVVREETT